MKLNLLLTLCLFFTIAVKAGRINPENLVAQSRKSLSFTENKGQVSDQAHKSRTDVLYSGSSGSVVFHLRNNGISYQFSRVDRWEERTIPGQKEKKKIKLPSFETIYRIDINWLNTSKESWRETDEALAGYDNYYTTVNTDGALNVKTYKGITYKNIYRNIDLHYYEKEGMLKYDYLLAAGADYTKIRWTVNGSTKLSLDEKGQLIMETPLGRLVEEAPLVIQNGKSLPAKWMITNNIVSFFIQNVDAGKSFVIDPGVRAWATYYGGSGTDGINGVTTDASGNVYITGATTSSLAIATTGAFQTTCSNSGYTAFLAKFNSAGTRQWATYHGNSGYDGGAGCVIDASGNVYMGGDTYDIGAPISTSGSYQVAPGGSYDAFLAKFDASGVRQWATYYGGTSYENVHAIAADASGNIFITGVTLTNSSAVHASAGAHQSVYGGAGPSGIGDGFIAKFNASGSRLWGTYYGGSKDEIIYGCSVDPAGNLYITGFTETTTGTVIATASGHQSTATNANSEAFLVKFSSTGTRLWGTYYGGDGYETGYDCAVDLNGNVYVCGMTTSTTSAVFATSGCYQSSFGGGYQDGFLAKFNTSGTRQWGTFFGATGNDVFDAGCTDLSGNIYLIGETSSTVGISTTGAYQTTYGGGFGDNMLMKFNSSGALQWSSYYGGPGGDYGGGHGNFIDGQGNVYFGGGTISNSGIATAGAHQIAMGSTDGSSDGYLVKFYECGPDAPANITAPVNQKACANASAMLTAAGSGTINWYSTPTSSTVLYSGSTYTTPSLSAGTYSYYVDAVTCSASAVRSEITVTVDPAPLVTVNSGTLCSGSSFTLQPSGASSFTISGGASIVTPLSNASYSVTGTSSVGCISASAVVANLTVMTTPTISVNSGSICSGNSFTIVPSGAGTYTISGNTFTVSPAASLGYSVTGTGTNGCVSASVVANVTVQLTPTISVNSGSLCSGKSFTINPSGASAYTVTGNSFTVTPTGTTSYSVIGTNTAGCISASAAVLTVSVHATPTIAVNSATVCSGLPVTLTPSGAGSYSITGNTFTISPSITTSYSVTGTSTAGCISASAAVLTVSVYASPTIAVNSATMCSGLSATLIPSGANSYTITGNSFTVSPAINTSYSVTGTSTAGCISNGSAVSTVSVFANPTISVNSATICSGNSVTLNPSGANTYTITGNTFTVSPAVTTSYSVIGTSSDGCISPGSAVSTVSVNTTPTLSVNSPSICSGNSFVIVPTGAGTYTITGNTFTVAPFTTTSYTIAGTSTANCVSAIAVSTITVKLTPTVSVNSATICAGKSVTLVPTGTASYVITGNNFTVAPAITTSYSVTGISAEGCVSSNTAISTILVNSLPSLTVTSSSATLCIGESAVLSVAGASAYAWSSSQTGMTITITPSVSTSYSVIATDINGCENSSTFMQSVNLCTGIQVLNNTAIVSGIYPNPTNGQFTVETLQEAEIIVMTLLGQIIYSGTTSDGKNNLSLSDYANGIYFVKVIAFGRQQTLKLVKE